MTVFPLWHVALTVLVAASASLVVLRWRFTEIRAGDAIAISIVVGVSVLGWRLNAADRDAGFQLTGRSV